MSRGRGKEAANATSQPQDQGLSWVIFRAAVSGCPPGSSSGLRHGMSCIIFSAVVTGCLGSSLEPWLRDVLQGHLQGHGHGMSSRVIFRVTEAWGSEWWEVKA